MGTPAYHLKLGYVYSWLINETMITARKKRAMNARLLICRRQSKTLVTPAGFPMGR